MIRKDVNNLKRKTSSKTSNLPVFRRLKDEELVIGFVYYVKSSRLHIYGKCVYRGMITMGSISKYCFTYGTLPRDWARSIMLVLPRFGTLIYGCVDPEQ